jgi:uncharacterized iron-regulated membrane protein
MTEFFVSFFSLLLGAVGIIAVILVFDLLLGVILWSGHEISFGDGVQVAFRTALSLNGDNPLLFAGWWGIVEFLLELSGLVLTGIVIAAAIEALRAS